MKGTMKMTNFQAFCRGFWSAWDFSQPFTQKQSLYPPEEKFDALRPAGARRRDRFGQVGHWQKVGGYLREAMAQYKSEHTSDVPKR